MSQLASHAHVSLHPLASRHGTNSSTLVSVNLPSANHCQQDQAQDEPADNQDGQGTPRLRRSSPQQSWSRHAHLRSPSPRSLPQSLLTANSEPPSYGIQHANLEDYPVIYEEALPSDSCSEDEDDEDDTFDNDLAQTSRDPFSAPRRQRVSKRSLAAPVRAMSADQLAQLHEQYVAQDVPHSVVFPFLHGVDGSIPAQNAFFGAPLSGQPTPPYRGLTILRADMPTPQEMERMQASSAAYTSARARARTFSSVTTQSSGSSPDTDDESSRFEATWNSPKSPTGCNFAPPPEANAAFSAASTASVSPSTASTVSSQTSRPSLFSVTSESYSASSRTSVSTVSDITDDGARAPGKDLCPASPTPFEAQPHHSLLNSTVFPAEIIRPPSICRTMYGRNVYGDLSDPGSFGDEGDGNEVRRIGPTFINPQQASGVSLRNFKIQCAKYATISDIVIYCPFGYHSGVMTLAKWVREAQASLRRERLLRGWGGLQYNVFVVTDSFTTFEQRFPSLVSVDSNGFDRNRVDFVDRERDEMERMTRATEIYDNVWLGCTADAPGVVKKSAWGDDSEPITPDEQANPHCFSVCINCEEDRSLASSACTPEVLRNAAQYLDSIDASMRVDDDTDKLLGSLHRDQLLRLNGSRLHDSVYGGFRNPDSRDGSIVLGPHGWTPKPQAIPVRTDASASHFVHSSTRSARLGVDGHCSDLSGRGLLRLDASSVVHLDYQSGSGGAPRTHGWHDKMARKIIDVCAWIQQQASPPTPRISEREAPAFNTISSTLRTFRDGARSPTRSFSPSQVRERTSNARAESPSARRPRRVLLHCPDGYTESSVLALSYLMYARELSLAEAYLDLQLRANRSFFVYPADVALLEVVDRYLQAARAARSQAKQEAMESTVDARKTRHAVSKSFSGSLTADGRLTEVRRMSLSATAGQSMYGTDNNKRSTLAALSPAEMASGICRTSTPTPKKCRANSPSVEVLEVEKHVWFNKSRFDGSFPSRILPFLYLGNLDHASNVDMLRVLGITHLVSVGETALQPPDHISAKVNPPRKDKDHGRSRYQRASAKAALAEDPSTVPSCTYQSQGVTVLNVRNVSDDGIDSLRGTMREAVQFIEAARLSGGKVLVHCRVGVSRSTTIVLAYVMAHLDLGLVESYLLVRSRRLNIVIQPHLLFLWELRGWETFLYKAKQAQINLLRGDHGSPGLVRSELPREASRALSALSIRSSTARSDEGSGSYKSAWSSPSGSPMATSTIQVSNAEAAASSSDGWSEEHLLGVEIGAGAGSIHGFDMAQSATMPFGSGSPTGLPYSASRLTWGHLAREIAELNSRYFV
ncbi:related to protein tyrosine phosphatase PPS1 [Ustilago trichophora]|uniref:Related to protein tyrosine phosphatase PPS1 n=1 Tax=Ustilago trichophora TaxID=86804 RepID=A0A5C3E473_9BASI|nr:related to protein tyrosine phosphatase PPS1 [Ustilago trichophora]